MKKALLSALLLGFVLDSTAQTGTEFWLAPPDVTLRHNMPGDEPIFLNVASGPAAATVTISQPANPGFNGGAPIVINLAANAAQRYNMTALKAQLETRPTNTICNTGLRIQSTANITCYYESSNTNNPDIIALKGPNALGVEFYIPLHKHPPFFNHDYSAFPTDLAFASFDIVATQANTQVMIYSPVAVDGHPALVPFTITLNQGQTYSCANTVLATHTNPLTHPSGAVVLADKPVAISIKDDSNHNPSGGCYDLISDQIVPVNILGTDYIAVKGQLNPTGDESMFIMAVQNNTQIYFDGNPVPAATLFAGQMFRWDMDFLSGAANNASYVHATKPVYAMHATGFGCEMGMAILPPLNCAGSTQLSFTRSTAEAFYLNVMIRAGAQNSFVVTPATATIPGAAFQPVPGTGGQWLAAQIQYNTTEVPVNQSFRVTNSADVFSLGLINGGGVTGCRYGFFSEFAGDIVVNAGPDQNICANSTVTLAGSVTGGTTTGIWTSTGSGTFTPSNTALNATYNPSLGDLALGSVTLTLTSTGNCTPENDAMSVTFQAMPIPNAGPDRSICSNNPAIAFAATVQNAVGGLWGGGAGTFSPSTSNLNATYTPTAAEIASGSMTITLTTNGNGVCPAVVDNVAVTFTPSPTANTGADQTLCANNAVATLAGSITVGTGGIWSGGAGSFSPSTTNLNATYTPTAAEIASGSVLLALTTTGNGNCNAVSDPITLTYTPAPTSNAGPDASICVNNAAIALNGTITVATGGQWSGGTGTFSPNSTTLNASYTPTAAELAAGTLTLTLTTTGNGNCVPVSDSRVITFTPAPIVNAGPDGAVCASAPTITLAGSVIGATGGIWSGGAGTFAPNNTTLNATYTPTAAEITAGSVVLTLTSAGNGNCNAEIDQVTWSITPAPTVGAGADQTLCGNNATASLNAVITVATGVQWTGGAGTYAPGNTAQNITYSPSPIEIANGSVTLTATTTGNGTCLAASDAVTLTFTAAPTADAGADASICANNAAISLNGSVTVATGGIWTGGTGVFNPGNTALNATYTPTAAEIAGGSLVLTLTTTGNGTCVAAADGRTITFTPAPVANAGTDGSVCANAAAITLAGSITGATGGIWSGGAGTFAPNNTTLNATYTPTAAEITAGTVTLTLTSAGNGNCNAVSDQVSWTITPAPSVNAGSDQTLCANNANATLNAVITIATGVQWSGGTGAYAPGSTAQNITYSPSPVEIANGSVTLTATTTGNGTCAAVADAVTLNFTPAPTANAGADASICANNAAITLTGSVTVATGGQWSGGTGAYNPSSSALSAVYTPTAAEIAAGTLTLTLTTTGNGSCSPTSDAVTITFTPAPTVNAGADGTVCASVPAMALNGTVSGATGGIWSGGAGTFAPNNTTLNATYAPTAAEISAGSVTLTLTSAGNGNCNAVSDQVTWTITPTPTVNTGADQTLCGNNATATLNAAITVASGVQWSGGAGTYSPGSTALNITYAPSPIEIANGSVTLMATTTGNGTCLAASDQVTLSFTAAPTANAGADASACVNNAAITLNGSVTVATGGQWSGGLGTYNPGPTALNAVYSPTAAEIAGGSLTLTLTTTGNGTCSPTSDAITITFTPAPVVNAGVDGIVCANTAAIALNGSIAGASGGIWSGGTGSFAPNTTTLNAAYTPSAAEITAGTVTLTLTSAGNGNCLAVSDQVTWTITPAPTVNAGPDQTLCANNATANLNAALAVASGVQWSGGAGSYTPSNTAQNITYAPSVTEIANGFVTLTVTTTGNGSCLAASDQVTLSFTNAPTANAGADATLCVNNAAVSLSGSVTVASGGIWSGGTGTFVPGNTALNTVYTPTAAELAAGNLVLTLTTTGNGSCTSVNDAVSITFTPAPIVNAGPNGTVCANAPAIALAGSVSGATGGIWSGGAGTYVPNNTTLNATYAPSAAEIAAGSVTITLTSAGNGNCNAVSDQVTWTITPAPTVNAGADQTLCGNNASANLNATFTVASGVQWSGGSGAYAPGSTAQNITYAPSPIEIANGSVTLTVTTTGNGSCLAVSDQVTLNFTPAPSVNAGPDQSVSANNPDATLAGSFTVATGVQWTGGLGSFNPGSTAANTVYSPTAAEIASGTLTLTLTTTGNGNCAATSDAMTITFTAAPTANAGPDQSVCANNPTATLNGSVTVATGGIWSGGAGSFAPNSSTLNATYTPSASEISAGTVTLTLTTVGNGNSLPVTDQMTITITPAPIANAGANITTCANQSNAQLVGSVSGATGGIWSGGSGGFNPSNTNLNAIYSPTLAEIAAGTVTLTLTSTGNGNCNAVADQVLITIVPAPVVDAGPGQTTCANNPGAALAGSVAGAGGGIWSGGTGVFSPNVTALNAVYTPSSSELTNGSVTLTLTSTGNGTCAAVSDQVLLVFSQSPVVNAGSDATVCQNAPGVVLNGAVTIATGGTWTGGGGIFSPNANTLNATYSPSPAEIALGTVTLTLTSTGNGNCNPVSDAMTITILPAPVVDAGAALFVCSNNAQVQLGGSVTGAGGGQWSGGAGTFSPSVAALNATYTPTAAEISAGTLTLTLTSIGNGFCQPVTDQVTITFTPAPTADAGTGAVFCANNANIALNGSVTVANGGSWSGVQGTFSPNANSLNAVYTPSAGEIAAGFVTLTLTTTGNNGCNAVSDQVTYTFSPAPTSNAGANAASCANNASVTLNGAVTIATGGIWTGGGGSYAPTSSTLNATYTPSAAEITAGTATLTLTTIGNGTCNPVSDQMTITIGPAPVVDAGAPLQSCANNPNAQLSGTVQNATGGSWSGAGTFFPGNTNLNAIYTPTAAEIAAGTATVTLTSTGNGLCNAVSDPVTITIIPSPIPNAGPDQTRCSNNAGIQLAGGVTNAGGGTWSGGLGSYAPNANALNAVYTPTPAEVASGSLNLTLTTTGNNGCNPVTDQVTITFTPSPTANAGADALSCANNPGVALNGSVTVATGGLWSGGGGSYAPNSSTLNATYTPTAAEITAGTLTLTLTTVGNGNCAAVSDALTITIAPSPIVDAGTPLQSCANNANVGLNGSVQNATGGTWTGAGTFSPNANTLNATYTPTAAEITAGTATLTLTSTGNGLCNAVSDQVTITINPAPVANAGPDQSRCSNNASLQLAGGITGAAGGIWSGGAGSYAPNSVTLSATYTPTAAEVAAGSVTLTLTTTGNGLCNAVTDQVTISFTPSPTANAGTDLTSCANNPAVSLLGTVTVATGGIWSGGGGSYSPNSGVLNAVYTPNATEISAGTATLTLTTVGNGNCSAVTDQVTIIINPAPLVDAGAPLASCANNPNVQLAGSVQNAGGGVWSGAGTFSPNNTNLSAIYSPTAAEVAAGTAILTLTSTSNGLCNAVSDQVTITIGPAPIANAGTDQLVCANNASIALAGSVTNASGGTWSGAQGSFSPGSNTLNATYTPSAGEVAAGFVTLTLTTTGNGLCTAVSDQVTYTFSTSPTANAGADAASCANNAAVTLAGAVTVSTGGIWSGGAGSFNPSNTALNAVYIPNAAEVAAGSVTLTLTTTGNGNCTAVSDAMTISIAPAPIVDAGSALQSCANAPTVQLAGSVQNATGGSWSGAGSFSPSNTALNATYTPTAAEIVMGSAIVTLASTGNGLCNAVSDQVTITIAPPPVVNAGSDGARCANNASIQLAGAVANAGGGVWSGAQGSFNPGANALNAVYTPSLGEIAAGFVTLTLTSTGNGLCAAVSDQVTYTFTPAPTANAGADAASCANNAAVTLNGAVTVATGGLWSGGTGSYNPGSGTLNATYTPSAAEIAAGTATLTLTTVGNGTCNAVSDQMTISIAPAPIVDAGTPLQSCANDPDVQLAGNVQNAAGGQWSGAGTFSPSSINLNATYTPTAAEIAAGTAIITLSSTGNGLCNAVTDQVTVTIAPAPVVNAGGDQVLCANNANIQLAGQVTNAGGGSWSGAQGSFSPSANSLNAVYTPSQGEIVAGSVTLTLTSTGNGLCNAVSDQVTFSFTPAPTANAGADAASCANNASVTLNGAVTIATGGIWSGGTGSFSPNNGTLNATYSPGAAEIAAGTATLTLTTVGNGNCTAVSDQMTIAITPAPVVDAGVPLQSCANNATVQLAGSIANAGGGVWSGNGTFSDNTVMNATYTPTAAEISAGTATVTLTSTGNGLCSAVSDQVTITITPAPAVNAGPDQTLCANNSNVQLVGSISVAAGGVWSGGLGTFSPNSTNLNAVYAPTSPELTAGFVDLTLTSTGNGGCVAVSDIVHIVFTPAPTATAGADALVCANNASVPLNGAITVAAGGIWSGGNGIFTPGNTALNATYTPTINEINGGSVDLTLTTTGIGNCIAVTDQMHITISPVPVVNAGPDQQICKNNPNFQLSGFVGNATGGVWTGGAGTYFPGNTALSVQYTPTAAEIASGSVTFTLSSTGMSVCAPVADQVTIVFTESPVVNAGVDQLVCTNNANVQLQGTVANANGGAWSGGNGTFSPSNAVYSPIYTPTAAEIASGTLTLTLTSTGNGNCFAVQDNMVILFTPAPTIDAGADLSVCANNPTLQLNGAVTVAQGAIWSGGSGTYVPGDTALNATYTLTPFEIQTGSFVMTLSSTGNGNCLAVQDDLTVTVIPEPVVDAGADIVTCANDLSVALSGSVQGMTTTGTWTTSGTGTFAPSANTVGATYLASSLDSLNGSVDLTLTSTNNGLCNAVSDVMTLTILPNGMAGAGADVSICSSEPSIQLNGTIMGNATGGTWTSTGAGTFSPAATVPNASYILDPADVGTLTFTWSVNSCDNATDQMVATIVPVSVATAGPDQTVCVDDLDVLINGSVSGASNTGVWSTTGTGVFTNPGTVLSNIYQASPQDSIAQGVDLILVATNTGVCAAAVDTMHIEIFPYGTVSAGGDLSFCANNANVVLNGTMTGDADQFQWTTSGTGSFFPNSTLLNVTYVPSAVDTAIGGVTLTLSAMNSCNQATDAMALTLTPAPYVNAGPDQTYCNQISQFTLSGTISGVTNVGQWSTTGTGTIANAGSLNTTYSASAADLAAGSITFVLSSLNNGNCAPVTDEMTIWITDGITADAGPDQSVCVLSDHAQLMGNILNGSPSGVWTTSGSGTFSPSADLLNTQYFFTPGDISNGVVVLTLTSTNNGTCTAAQDQMILTFGGSSYAYAGADVDVCANDPIVQLNGNFSGGALGCQWSTSGTGFFSNTSDPAATYTLSPSDIALGGAQLTLTTITDGTCTPASDAMAVTVPGLPSINAGPDQIVCTNAPVQLFANVINAPGGIWTTTGTGTFLDPNALVTLYTPSPADSLSGSVILLVTTAGTGACNAVSDAVTINFGGGLSASAGADEIACSTDPNIILNGAVNGTTTGVWSTSGTGSFSPSATALNATYIPGPADFIIGTIDLVISTTNNQGCPAGRDTLVVTYHVPPMVDAGAGVLLCDGLEDVPLNAVVQYQATMQWFTTGTGTFSPGNDVPNAVYTPSLNDSLVGGVYLILTAYGTAPCGNTSDSLLIDIGPTRIADAGTDITACATGQPLQLDGSITGVSGGQWTTNGTGTFSPSATDPNATYTPSVTDLVFPQLQFLLATTGNQGCPADVDTLMLFLEQSPTANAGPDVNTCDASQGIPLSGAVSGAAGAQWTTNGSGTFVPDDQALNAIYQPGPTDSLMQEVVLVLTTLGNQVCAAAVDSVSILFVNPLAPDFSFSGACVGNLTSFTDQSTISNGNIIAWNWDLGNGATPSGQQVSTTYLAPGPYDVSLTVVSQSGCSATLMQTVNVLAAPVAGFGLTGELLTGETIVFSDSSQGAVSWQYNFGDGFGGSLDQNPSYVFPEAGQFIVVQTVTNAAGCTDADSMLVIIGASEILPPKLPNAFSPNGDGVNDVFYVRGGPFEELHLMIYNGWGELIFETIDPEFGWDGTYKGTPEANGVYTYIVKAKTVDGFEHDRPGKVNLIR